jgi:hypothetical protein
MPKKYILFDIRRSDEENSERRDDFLDSKRNVKSLRLCRSSATIKQHICTPAVHPFIVMAPKHVLLPHRAHSFIVNVQPTFPTTAVPIRVEQVNRIMSAGRGLAVVVEHPIELV